MPTTTTTTTMMMMMMMGPSDDRGLVPPPKPSRLRSTKPGGRKSLEVESDEQYVWVRTYRAGAYGMFSVGRSGPSVGTAIDVDRWRRADMARRAPERMF